MPSSTFFRLPEEKRQRLLNAAREEFERTRFNDASINRIVCRARIPRGSFYQYFSDKEDLFRYLLGDIREYFITVLQQILKEAEGDLFAVPAEVFDRFVGGDGAADPVLVRCVAMMRVNPGMDMQWLVSKERELISEETFSCLNPSLLRRQDREYAQQVLFMLLFPLAHAIMETLCCPEQRTAQRELLEKQIEIIRFGGAASASSGLTEGGTK